MHELDRTARLAQIIDSYPMKNFMEDVGNPDTIEAIARNAILVESRLAITRLSVYEAPVSDRVLAEQEWMLAHFRQKTKDAGLSIPDPIIMYVDLDRMIQDDVSMDESETFPVPDAEFYDPYTASLPKPKDTRGTKTEVTMGFVHNSVVVIGVSREFTDLQHASICYHELTHYYGHYVFEIHNIPHQIYVNHQAAISRTRSGRPVGKLIAEGYTLNEQNTYENTRGRRQFPDDWAQKVGALPFLFLKNQRTRYTATIHARLFKPNDKNAAPYRLAIREHLTDELITIYRELTKRVAGFTVKYEQARMNNNWNGLGRDIDQLYGRGTFRLLMSLDHHDPFVKSRPFLNYVIGFLQKKIPRWELQYEFEKINK